MGIFAAIWSFLVASIPAIVIYVMTSIGIGFATYSGLDIAFGSVQTWFFSSLSGLPADALAIMGMAKIDVAAKIIISAYPAAFATKMFIGGGKKLVFN